MVKSAKGGISPILFLVLGIVVVLASYYFIRQGKKPFFAFVFVGIGLAGWGVFKMLTSKPKPKRRKQPMQQYPQQQGYPPQQQMQQPMQPQQGYPPQQQMQQPVQPQQSYCPYCKNAIAPGSSFCPYCGARFR